MQLPEAYRSLSRPSSAPDAKAFALCSFSLELPIYIVCSLNCLSFFVKQDKYFSHWKGLSFSCRFLFPPFGEIVICYPNLERLNLLLIVSSLSVRFFNSFKSKYLNFFFSYSIVKFHVALLLFRFLFASPSWDDQAIKFSSLELCLSGLPDWSVWMDSNHRPRAYQARALATWATDRFTLIGFRFVHFRRSAGFRTFNSTSSSCWTSRDLRLRYFSNPRRKPLLRKMVEMKGFEPLTPCLQGRCSPNWATPPYSGLYLRTLNWILTIEQQNLSVQHVIHIYQVFCPNLTTSAQSLLRLALTVSIERRWSSRTFRYGYLVTT